MRLTINHQSEAGELRLLISEKFLSAFRVRDYGQTSCHHFQHINNSRLLTLPAFYSPKSSCTVLASYALKPGTIELIDCMSGHIFNTVLITSYELLSDDRPHAVQLLLAGRNLTMRVDGGVSRCVIFFISVGVTYITTPGVF